MVEHDETRPADPGGLQNGYGHGVAVDGGEARGLRLVGAGRVGFHDDEGLLEPIEQPGDEGADPAVAGDDGVVLKPSSGRLKVCRGSLGNLAGTDRRGPARAVRPGG